MNPYHPSQFPDFERPRRSRLQALAARLAFGCRTAWQAMHAFKAAKEEHCGLVFVAPDVGQTSYYGSIPDHLISKVRFTWFIWTRKLIRQLTIWDVIKATFAFYGLDAGSLDYDIPYYSLVELATMRLARKVRPKVTLSYLEHHPYARAHYAGMNKSGCGAINYAVQHSSKASGKVGELPNIETIAHPDYIFAMGLFSKKLFMDKCGYSDEQIIVTGSPRYDYLKGAL